MDLKIFFIEILSLIWAWWSFKMHRNLFKATPGDVGKKFLHHHKSTITWLKHNGTGILHTGVCLLGKLGAWMLLFWTIILLISIYVVKTPNFSVLGYLNLTFVSIVFVLSGLMNFPLWVRLVPYFILQILVIYFLFYLSQLPK